MKKKAIKTLSAALAAAFAMQIFTPVLSARAQTKTLVFGDVNLDGTVSLKDSSVIAMYSAELCELSEKQLAVADINGDGKVSLIDAYIIQKYTTYSDFVYADNPNGDMIGDEMLIETDDDDTDTEVITSDTDSASDIDTDTETETDIASDTETETETETDFTDIDTENTDTESDDVTDTEEYDTEVITDIDTDTESDQPVFDDTETETDTEEEDTDTYTDTSVLIEEINDPLLPVNVLPEETVTYDLNGDFERGGDNPENWLLRGSTKAAVTRGKGVNGSNCICLNGSSESSFIYVINYISGLEPGADYKLTAKIKGDNIGTKTNGNGAYIDAGFCNHYGISSFEGSTSTLGRGSNIASLNNWKKGSFDWSEATVYFVPDIHGCADILCLLQGSGTAYYDDLKIEKIDDFNADQTVFTRYKAGHIGLVLHREDCGKYDQSVVQEWANEIDEGYDIIARFYGRLPHWGDVVYIISTEEPYVGGVQAYGAITPIKWLRGYAALNCKNRCEKNVKSAVPFHELGHNFDTCFGWTFYGEGTADFCALLVSSMHPDDVYDFRGWGNQMYAHEDLIEFVKSGESRCYDKIIVNRDGDYYVVAMAYIMYRCCATVGFDVAQTALHRMRDINDTRYNTGKTRLMYLLMNMQETYNEKNRDATGRELYDSFPEGELDYIFTCLDQVYRGSYSEDQNIYTVEFVDLDGSNIGFDFVQHGTAAQAPTPKASDKYGAFTGWTADISSVTSNMVVTPVYENSPKISVDIKNLDDPSSGTFNLGDHVFVTISDNESGEYRVTAPGFDSGFGNPREFSFMLTSSGTNSIRVEKRLSDGTVFTALSKNISVARAVTVYYSGFSAPNIHYCVQNGTWTAVPGVKMNASSSVSGYTHRYVIPLTNATDTTVKCCFNDGNNNWDNNNQNDYTLTEGVFGIKNGSVTDLTK